MSRFWKWVLGILGVLIVVGLMAGAVFMWRNRGLAWGPRAMMYAAPNSPNAPQLPGGPFQRDDYGRYHMDGRGWDMPMMRGRGYTWHYSGGPFGTGLLMLAGLVHLALPLGLLALVAYIFYQMGKRAGSASATAASGSLPNVDSLPRRRVARR